MFHFGSAPPKKLEITELYAHEVTKDPESDLRNRDSSHTGSDEENDETELSVLWDLSEELEQNPEIFKPIVKLCWPQDSGLWEDEKWPWTVLNTINSMKMTEMGKNVEKAFLLMADCINKPTVCKADNLKGINWISKNSQALSKHGEAMKILLRISWPNEKEMLSEKWLHKLIKRSKEDKETVCNFAEAAKIILRCFEVEAEKPSIGVKMKDQNIVKVIMKKTKKKLGGKEKAKADQKDDEDDEFKDAPSTLKQNIVNPIIESKFDFMEFHVFLDEVEESFGMLCMVENCWQKWKPISMQKSSPGCYFIQIPVLDNIKDLLYKYVLIGDKEFYEVLSNQNKKFVNRVVKMEQGGNVIHDMPNFPIGLPTDLQTVVKRKCWHHLPIPNKILLPSEEGSKKYSLNRDVYAWLNSMKRGWRTNGTEPVIYISNKIIHESAVHWLHEINSLPKQEKNLFITVLCGISILMAYDQLKVTLDSRELLLTLSECLSMDSLSLDQQRNMYKEICLAWKLEKCNQKCNQSITSAFRSLFKGIDNLNDLTVEWILVLPTYWLIYNYGEILEKPRTTSENIEKWTINAEAFTPCDMNMFRKKCTYFSVQKSMMGISERVFEISKTHPWITGTFISILTPKTLGEMLQQHEKYKLSQKLPLDMIVCVILKEWKTNADKPLKNILDAKTYIESRCQSCERKQIKGLSKEKLKAQHQAALRILSQIVQVVTDMADFKVADDNNNNMIWFLKMSSHIATWSWNLVKILEESYEETRCILTIFVNAATTIVENNLRKHKDCFKFVSSVINISWTDSEFQKTWKKELCYYVEQLLPKIWQTKEDDGFLNFFERSMPKLQIVDELNELLEKYASKCCEDFLQTTQHKNGDHSTKENASDFVRQKSKQMLQKMKFPLLADKFGRILVKKFDLWHSHQSSKDIPEYSKTVEFLSSWPFAMPIFNHFYSSTMQNEKLGNKLTKIDECIIEIMQNTNDVIGLFKSGKLNISMIEMFIDNCGNLFEINSTINKEPRHVSNHDNMSSVDHTLEEHVRNRKKQIDAISLSYKFIVEFMELCALLNNEKIQMDMDTLGSFLHKPSSLLASVIDLYDIPENPNQGIHSYGNMGGAIAQRLYQISSIKGSEVFLKMWVAKGQDIFIDADCHHINKKKIVSWKMALFELWNKVQKDLESVFFDIQKGSLTISHVLHWFRFAMDTDNPRAAVTKEVDKIKLACGKSDENLTLKAKCRKICDILKAKLREDFADLIYEAQNCLELNDQFQELQQVQKVEEDMGNTLNQFKKESNYEFLNLTSRNVAVLRAFLNQQELFRWLKLNMQDRRGVKVFCDLGMISAGESAYEVDKVSCLLSAVIGFSPLIFDVSEDVSLEDFVKLCEEVGTNYAKDANLIQNWNDTSNRLEWFEMICNLHGSVENQSLMQVQEINKCGIYVIKKPNKGNIDMNNCVQLVLSGSMGKEGKEEKKEKILALNDLIDLQSKLMLIAGESDKGQEDVARFNEVLMAVETFTKAFVDLLNMGCMLFDDFNAKFICGNHENEISDEILMIIHFAEDAPPLSQTGTIKDIQSIAQVLMKAYEDWILRIDDLRNTYYYLNEFSQDQVVYLCKKLMQKHLPDQVFTLLNCHSIQDIKEALADLQEDEIQNDSCFTSNLPSSELEAEIDPNLIEKKVQLVKKIVDSCDEAKFDMTRAAVQDLGLADELDILTWIWDHEKDKELIIKLSEEFKNDEDFAYAEQNTTTYPQLLQNRDQFTLTEILFRASICEKLDPGRVIKTICCDYSALESRLKVKNFLNIKHLGKFLLKLKESISTASNICQKLYDPLKAGQPNIVVCPANEILIRIISFYNNNQNLPLPSNSEVLLCNRNTSADEVERFLKRVMFSCNFKSQLIHCMACADYLEDSVFSHLQKVYETLSVSANLDQHYKLVVLVSKQKHPIITYFDKYIIELKSHLDKNEISQYLAKKLVTCDDVKKPLITIVTSNRSGVGKSLYVQRKMDTLGDEFNKTTIRLLQKTISIDQVVEKLSRNGVVNNSKHFIHMDFTPAIQHGVDQLVFNLFILGSISNKHGKMWRRYPQHTYAIELTSSVATSLKVSENQILSLFPKILCVSPRKACQIYESDNEKTNEVLFDEKEFRSDVFQRPYQYLSRLHLKKNLDKFSYTSEVVEDKSDCINTLLLYCGITDPSWAQIKHFASFLNLQLGYCETSEFCKMSVDSKTFDVPFRGLKSLAIRFMIKMAQDLSTPSLTVSDESIHDVETSLEFASHQIRRKWEEENHPFVFFNKDHVTMTFMNVKCAKNGNILDENGIAIPDTAKLAQDLKMQNVPLGVSFDSLKRIEKLRVLCQFMGISKVFDPDPTYELTTDNALKMLAVYMRLQCDIPVIVMGETGCGKTRMVEFMSKLKAGSHNLRNMVTLKVHGGIESAHIYECVKSAQRLAEENAAIPEDEDCDLGTVLFFDGANTTEAIYAIKEVVCDFSIEGESFRDSNLKIVAACNPYKQLSAVAIKNLEESGLGYCVRESKDTEKVGGVSMRTLVYRVVSLPPSMQPFVWDFGQLTDDVERIYVAQMISHFRERLKLNQQDRKLIQSMICVAQRQVRKSGKDECRYVSLRDVERSIKTFEWFYNNHKSIFPRIEVVNGRHEQLSVLVRTLLQTLNVCYHASLTNRCEFRNAISSALKEWDINLSPNDIYEEFIACQIAFFNDLKMPDNIACNEALRENVFLMIVCAELRIPLFLVGKPGSSKSLAKTIVSDNMQGGMSSSQLCKKMKQVHMLSYQCSALTDANGIEAIFKQCTQLQAKQDLDKYVAVVVLDEIGLAEDSANMPLKVLHPLLECGSTDNSSLTDIDPKMKVGFIGISNWSLDPAKMNRGIFVTRTKMKKGDLKETAKGIFANQTSKINEHATLLNLLTNLYLEVYESQREEYFGLRDYYSLIKMIYSKCVQKINGSLTQRDVEEAVSRNFGGGQTDYKKIFRKCMDVIYPKFLRNPISVQDMLAQNLKEESSRFLLILTNQVSSVDLLKLALKNCRFQIVFGSTFPNDSTYTERCRNINRVKVCMENGRTVVLLNLSAIHESLYDVLNQQYVSLRNQRYVDLGLGGHRVKSRIAQDFRLIVLEQKDIAYTKYPIPLLNRLEKHHLTAASMIQGVQKETVKNIDEWVCKFTDREGKFSTTDCFIGFHEDTVASILLSGYQNIEECQHVLLNSAAPESVFRLPKSRLQVECKELQTTYLQMQTHDNLWDLLLHLKNHINESVVKLLEIPSYSDILSGNDRKVIETYLDLPTNHVMLMSLQQIKTNQEFIKKLGDFLNQALLVDKKSDQQSCMVLLIQCAQAHKHVQLIACARYGILNTMPKYLDDQKHKSVIVAFLLSTDRTVVLNQSDHSTTRLSSILQPTSDTETVFIDEFKPHQKRVKITMELNHLSISELLSDDINHENYKHVHIPTLLKDCVWQAMSKLSDSPDNDDRLYHRIKILTELFSGNTDCSKRFLNIFIKKLNIILDQKNKEDVEHETWLVKEACDFRRLQDGGSFGKTLWLCLKRHVSVVLAYITSILDEDDNLNIIEDVKLKGMHNMWLQIFDGFEFHWHDIPKNPEFRVLKRQLYIRGEMQIPFSSKLRSIMDIQWIIAGGNRKIFFNLFRTSQPKIACAIGEAWIKFKQMDFIKSYASALIYAEYKAEKETECLASVLCKAAFQKLERLKEKHEFANEDALSIIFHLSKKYSKHLQIILDILKMNTELSIEYDEWIKGQSDSKVFIVHELALDTAITFLDKGTSFKDEEECRKWIILAKKLKHIFYSSFDLIGSEEKKQDIFKKWERLSVLNLLLLHLLPDFSDTSKFAKYAKVISTRVKMLSTSLKNGFRNQAFFRRMLAILKRYYNSIKSNVKMNWKSVKCCICKNVACTDFQVLSCGDFAGRKCIPNHEKCPLCMKKIDRSSDIRLTELEQREVDVFLANCTSFFLEFLSQFCFSENAFVVDEVQDDDIRVLLECIVFNCKSDNESKPLLLPNITALDINIHSQSAILTMIIMKHDKLVEKMINEWISNYNPATCEKTMTVLMRSLEQKSLKSIRSYKAYEKILKNVRTQFAESLITSSPTASTLSVISDIRYCLCYVAAFIQNSSMNEVNEDDDNDLLSFIYTARNFCNDDKSEQLKEYLVKIGCHEYGMEWFNQLVEKKAFKDFIPSSLVKTTSEQHLVDYWSLLGKDYLEMRSILNKNNPTKSEMFLPYSFQPNTPFVDVVSKLLALVTFIDDEPKHLDNFKHHIAAQGCDTTFDYLLYVYQNIRKSLARYKLSQQITNIIKAFNLCFWSNDS
uniref:E3 ubiquitin-protein ligase rnf213-alpha-like isoform X1 n=1 Tax=Styela clava TaxID=7725 RepID=UPI001939E35E|nr:E3 ubiquitin-protein ligase rnf213-alpha-like isoform X1 [Styela clava]